MNVNASSSSCFAPDCSLREPVASPKARASGAQETLQSGLLARSKRVPALFTCCTACSKGFLAFRSSAREVCQGLEMYIFLLFVYFLPLSNTCLYTIYIYNINIYIYGTALGTPTPHPRGWSWFPAPPPVGVGWGGCEWVAMLVDGVVVFANDVESYGICKELDLVRERRQTCKAHSLMMGQ